LEVAAAIQRRWLWVLAGGGEEVEQGLFGDPPVRLSEPVPRRAYRASQHGRKGATHPGRLP